jgi:hypothetical protein
MKDVTTTPLNEWPMIMVHDAATTYLGGGVFHPINNWAKTQPSGGPSALMDCGARSFDWRPAVINGKIQMHHASINVPTDMSKALDDMVSWANAKGK